MLEARGSILRALEKVLCDAACTGVDFAFAVKVLTGAEVEVVKRSELHKFAVIPKRRVVERSFGWLDGCRRIWKNCERKLYSTMQMVILAFISLFIKRS